MDSFTTRAATPASAGADATKRVNYTYGMVLGVDDFVQEQTYHAARNEWLARDLVGYGTVNGLAVSVGKTAQNETEVVVTAGAALSPRGQLIRVAPTQCANLSQWLAVEANRQAVREVVGSPPSGPVPLYVVLCYRACETDRVPIPGEPCRTEENATAPSRLTDDFKLELRLAPPAQLEEDALRDFVMWLEQHVEFTDEPGSFTDLETFRQTLLQAAHPVASPPSSPPDFMHDSPPDVMRVHASDSCQFLREAFRLWVTALRPRWRPVFGAGAGHEEEECLLLAELRAPLTPAGSLDETQPVEIDEERRPFVVHLRMLQEWVLCGEAARAMGAVYSPPSSSSSSSSQLSLDELLDVDAPAPQTGELLAFKDGLWVSSPAPPPSGPAGGDLAGAYPDPSVAGLRGRAVSEGAPAAGQALIFDGAQWAPTNLPSGAPGGPPTGPAGGDLAGAYPNPGVARLQARPVSNAAPAAGQVLTWDGAQWAGANLPAPPAAVKPGDAAGGDLSGTYPNPGVSRLRGRNVSGAAPAGGQVLTWDGAQWAPANLPPSPPPTGPAGGDLAGTYPNPSVSRLRGHPVSSNAPNDGDVLTWVEMGGRWQPARPLTKPLPFVTISASFDPERSDEFLFWFHLDAPDNRVEFLPPSPNEGILAFEESGEAPDFLSPVRIMLFEPLGPRNVFRVQLEQSTALMRFVFETTMIEVAMGEGKISLSDYMARSRVNFVGFDGERTVTAFAPLVAARVG